MKCLVTGAAGFIGHHLVKKLLDNGHEVIGVDNLMTGDKNRVTPHDRYDFLECPMQALEYEAAAAEDAIDLSNIDVVFHLAALPRVPVSFENPQLSLSNNVDSTIAALEVARKCGAAFVYSSSSSIYGTKDRMPFEESMEAHTESPYALSKWIGEELCEQYRRAFGVPYVALRYFNVYGPGMTKGGYATAIRTFMEQRAAGKPLTVTGDGLQERDFTHVHDVANANILAANALIDGRARDDLQQVIGAYNIGAGLPKVLLEVAKKISDNITFIEARREPKKTHASNKKAEAILGWVPTVDFDQALAELLTESV